MAKPTTRATFKNYCLRRLGFPVIDINVDDDQVDDRIDDALQFFEDYHFDGVEEMFLKHPGRLTNEAYDRLKGSFNRAFGGSQNAGGTAILEEGMDFQKVGLNPADAAFNETKKATISDIARITGVPGVLLEDMDKATFGNMEQLSQMFVNYTIMPFIEILF